MSFLTIVRTRWQVPTFLALFELGLAWLVGTLATAQATAPLASHPDGAVALFAEGSRIALDVGLRHPTLLLNALGTLGTATVLYTLFSIVFGAALPYAFASPVPVSLRHALAESSRCAPTLVLLALTAAVCYSSAVTIGWVSVTAALSATTTSTDARVPMVCALLAAIPSIVIAYSTHVWHDIARTHAMAQHQGASASALYASKRLLHRPGATLGVFTLVTAVSILLLAAELVLNGLRVHTGFALTMSIASQQLVLCARWWIRAVWVAYLTQPWHTRTA